jgi:hypothetical protein
MQKLMITLLTLYTFILLSLSANAATSKVTWVDYEKYRDIDPSNEGRKHFRERVFYNLEKHFDKLSAKLPEGQVLNIKVTDVDLAGDTHIGGISQIRIIKDMYSPRMNFSYELDNADGSIVTSDDVVLKDKSFMMGSALKYRNQSFGYEKKMLDDWFTKVFKEFVVKKK